jgi:hypothetical protein
VDWKVIALNTPTKKARDGAAAIAAPSRLSFGPGFAERVRLQLNLTLVLIVGRLTVDPVNLKEIVDGSAPGNLTKFVFGQFDVATFDFRFNQIVGLGYGLLRAHVCLLCWTDDNPLRPANESSIWLT